MARLGHIATSYEIGLRVGCDEAAPVFTLLSWGGEPPAC
jgi:hypothetical protein